MQLKLSDDAPAAKLIIIFLVLQKEDGFGTPIEIQIFPAQTCKNSRSFAWYSSCGHSWSQRKGLERAQRSDVALDDICGYRDDYEVTKI